jgi:hypothetical protein
MLAGFDSNAKATGGTAKSATEAALPRIMARRDKFVAPTAPQANSPFSLASPLPCLLFATTRRRSSVRLAWAANDGSLGYC